MLRHTKSGLLVGALALAALLLAGLRTPLVGETSNWVENGGTQDKSKQPLTGEFLPANAVAAAAIRVADLVRLPETENLQKLLNDLQPLKQVGLSVKDIDEIKVGVLDLINAGPGGPTFQVCVRTLKPFDWLKMVQKFEPGLVEAEFGGVKYLSSANLRPGLQLSFYMPDDRTVIAAPEARIRELIQSGGREARPAWADGWDKVAQGPVVAMVNVEVLGKVLDMTIGRMPDSSMTMMVPLWQNTRMALAGMTLDKGVSVHVIGEAPSPEAGKKVSKNLQALATLAENYLDGFSSKLGQLKPEEGAAFTQIVDIGKDLLAHLKITEQGNLVDIQCQSEKLGPNTITGLVWPIIARARQAAQRSASVNNLKQIALAMHNYHSTYNRFPAAVIIGPDGKTPHSWRVELLPYLEQNELFTAYKMDEPWDSPNNKKVLEKMPRVFAAIPDAGGTFSSYFVLSGDETAFPGERPVRIADITDGTSNTIMLVEAKRDIPWTKPEDIPYEAKKPFPKLGGFFPEGFNAALCDGSVRFLANGIAEPVLRALTTRGGGEIIPNF